MARPFSILVFALVLLTYPCLTLAKPKAKESPRPRITPPLTLLILEPLIPTENERRVLGVPLQISPKNTFVVTSLRAVTRAVLATSSYFVSNAQLVNVSPELDLAAFFVPDSPSSPLKSAELKKVPPSFAYLSTHPTDPLSLADLRLTPYNARNRDNTVLGSPLLDSSGQIVGIQTSRPSFITRDELVHFLSEMPASAQLASKVDTYAASVANNLLKRFSEDKAFQPHALSKTWIYPKVPSFFSCTQAARPSGSEIDIIVLSCSDEESGPIFHLTWSAARNVGLSSFGFTNRLSAIYHDLTLGEFSTFKNAARAQVNCDSKYIINRSNLRIQTDFCFLQNPKNSSSVVTQGLIKWATSDSTDGVTGYLFVDGLHQEAVIRITQAILNGISK